MATLRTRSMFDHTIDIVKGYSGPYRLTKSALISDNVSLVAYEGRVVHLNADGEWEMGCVGTQMACWLFADKDDPDIEATYTDDDRQAIPAGRISGYVANGSIEMATTEFDPALTYLPNELLRAVASNSVQATGGVMTNASVVTVEGGGAAGNVTACCGVVSVDDRTATPVSANSHRQNVLYFWPIYKIGAPGK